MLGFCTALVSGFALCSCFYPLGRVAAWVFTGDEACLGLINNQRRIRGSCTRAPELGWFVACRVVLLQAEVWLGSLDCDL